jgi:hypothetical protein
VIFKEVVQPVVRNFGEVFELEMRETSRDDLLAQLHTQKLSVEPNLATAQAIEIAS